MCGAPPAAPGQILHHALGRYLRQRWELEHVISRGMIGASAYIKGNMRPSHARPCHKTKSAVDADGLARAKRREAKHFGGYRPKHVMPCSRASGFKRLISGSTVRRNAEVTS